MFLDIDLFSSLRFKSTELSIAAYDTYQDLSEQQNPIFSSKEIKNKNRIATRKVIESKMNRYFIDKTLRRAPANAGPSKKARYPLVVRREFTLTKLLWE